MSILETKHTLSRVNIIKRDLLKAISIFSCISMLLFSAYYVYLMFQNLDNTLYLILYTALIICIISLYCIETFSKETTNLLRNEKRIAVEKKRRTKRTIKILKFIAKTILVAVAMYETFSNFNVSLSNILNICSTILLILQILFELIVAYIITQIDYFKLSIDLDIKDSSFIVKKLTGFLTPIKSLEDELIPEEERYSEQELKMIETIKENAEEYSKAQEERKQEILKRIEEKKHQEAEEKKKHTGLKTRILSILKIKKKKPTTEE